MLVRFSHAVLLPGGCGVTADSAAVVYVHIIYRVLKSDSVPSSIAVLRPDFVPSMVSAAYARQLMVMSTE